MSTDAPTPNLPENTWDAEAAEIRRWGTEYRALLSSDLAERHAALMRALAQDTPWPLADVLAKLIEASDILMHRKGYDGEGWELIQQATRQAKIIHRNLTVKIR